MTACKIGGPKVGQTYRVTRETWRVVGTSRRTIGDTVFIYEIKGDVIGVQEMGGAWGIHFDRSKLATLVRVGFHPDWNWHQQQQKVRELLMLADKKHDAKLLLAALPDKIQGYEKQASQLINELGALQKERKS